MNDFMYGVVSGGLGVGLVLLVVDGIDLVREHLVNRDGDR